MIDKIRQYHRIEILAARACGGLQPSRSSTSGSGRYFVGWCPFCQPNGPGKFKEQRKLWVDVNLQICNCFKARCRADKPMDVINLYARLHNLDNDAAIAALWLEYNLRTASR